MNFFEGGFNSEQSNLDVSSKKCEFEWISFWLKNVFTSPHGLQVLPQDLSCSAVGHQIQERLSVQATQLTTLHASQVWTPAVETKFSLAPVQPDVHLPLRPQFRIWTCANTHKSTSLKSTKQFSITSSPPLIKSFSHILMDQILCMWLRLYPVESDGRVSPGQIQQNWPSQPGSGPPYWLGWEEGPPGYPALGQQENIRTLMFISFSHHKRIRSLVEAA